MTLTNKEVFERYIHAGAMTRNPDAVAALFTEDGVYESPLVPDSHPLRRLAGRDAIRAGMSEYYQRAGRQGTMSLEQSSCVLHDTPDPGVFIAEIDVAFDEAGGQRRVRPLVQIFRLRDGQIAMLRDYFAASAAASQGELPPPSVVTTRSRAAGRWNRLSNRAMSWRKSETRGRLSFIWPTSGSTMVSPRPSIPRSSSGLTP